MLIAPNTKGRSGAFLRHRICSLVRVRTFCTSKNTPDRQDFIIGNLRLEEELVEA